MSSASPGRVSVSTNNDTQASAVNFPAVGVRATGRQAINGPATPRLRRNPTLLFPARARGLASFGAVLVGVVDAALWDLAGRAVGRPVWQLLGGFREAIAAYGSTATFVTTQEYPEVASQCLALGYDDVVLMYDGSAGFDLPDAVYLGHALAGAGCLRYEEPIRGFSVTASKWLAERVRVPLCVAETSDGAHMSTADIIASRAASFVRTSAELRGGITGASGIACLADAVRLRADVHGRGWKSCTSAWPSQTPRTTSRA
jgi:L-alanine-DL-glutamate epimerase-like enolase superfamily enzyme